MVINYTSYLAFNQLIKFYHILTIGIMYFIIVWIRKQRKKFHFLHLCLCELKVKRFLP